jgi:hypothetical protein
VVMTRRRPNYCHPDNFVDRRGQRVTFHFGPAQLLSIGVRQRWQRPALLLFSKVNRLHSICS